MDQTITSCYLFSTGVYFPSTSFDPLPVANATHSGLASNLRSSQSRRSPSGPRSSRPVLSWFYSLEHRSHPPTPPALPFVLDRRLRWFLNIKPHTTRLRIQKIACESDHLPRAMFAPGLQCPSAEPNTATHARCIPSLAMGSSWPRIRRNTQSFCVSKSFPSQRSTASSQTLPLMSISY